MTARHNPTLKLRLLLPQEPPFLHRHVIAP